MEQANIDSLADQIRNGDWERRRLADLASQPNPKQQAQAIHDKLMEAPAIFASSFYLADAAGMVRLVAWEPGANDAKIVRASVIMPVEAFVKLCEMGPKFIADVAKAKGPKKPTIEELERILASDDKPEVVVLPNGEVRAI